MLNEAGTSKYYPFLDGWRGFAILWIILGHIVPTYDIDLAGKATRCLFNFVEVVYLAVDIFFIITGFLITGILLADADKFDVKKFIKKRVFRILPLYFVLIFVAFAMNQTIPPLGINIKATLNKAHAYIITDADRGFFTLRDDKGNRTSVKQKEFPYNKVGDIVEIMRSGIGTAVLPSMSSQESVFPHLLLMQNYYPYSRTMPVLSHTWFLSVVVHFYIFYVVSGFFIFKFVKNPQKRKLFLSLFVFSLIVFINIFRYKFGVNYGMYYRMTHFRMDAILFGCLLKLGERPYLEKIGVLGKRVSSLFFFAVGFILFSILVLKAPNEYAYAFSNPYIFTLSYIMFGFMMIGTYRKVALSGFIFENSLIRWIGRYSYGIYLWHYPFMFLYYYSIRRFVHLNNFVSILIQGLLSIVIGAGLEMLFSRKRLKQ